MADLPWNLVLDDIGKRSEALKMKKTNADCIRNMSDEELAYFLNEIEAEAIKRAGRFLTAREIVNAQADRLDWLRREAEPCTK